MLKFSGSTDRTFTFPALPADAYEFFSDIERTVTLLPDIEIAAVSSHEPQVFRLVYQSNEMGVYEVRTICDVRAQTNPSAREVRLTPAKSSDFPQVKGEMTPKKSITIGELNATLTCMDGSEESTTIRYQFSMISSVPVSGLMRFVPLAPIEEMVQKLIKNRLEGQVDQFVSNAIQLYSTNQ